MMTTSLQVGDASLAQVKLDPVQADVLHRIPVNCFNPPPSKHYGPKFVCLRMKSTDFQPIQPLILGSRPMPTASEMCASALVGESFHSFRSRRNGRNRMVARSSVAQPQVLDRKTTRISLAPSENKSPDLADGGSGFPPRDGGDGGGGGGGGGSWGGFFLFAFLAFLGYMKDKEDERAEERANQVRRDLDTW